MKSFSLLAILSIFCMPIFGQQTNADSLEQELKNKLHDTARINILNIVAKEYCLEKEKSNKYSRQAIKISYLQNDKRFLGQSYNLLGRNLFDQGSALDAVPLLDSAQQYFFIAKDTTHAILSRVTKGLCFWKLGEYENGIKIFADILAKYKDRDPRIAIGSYNNLALIYDEQKRYVEAMRYYEKSLEVAIEYNDQRGMMLAHNNISILLRHDKKFVQAIASLKEALKISLAINNKIQIGRSYSNLGATYTQMNESDSAEFYLLKAYGYEIEQGITDGFIKTTWHLAELYEKNNQLNLARKYAKQSLKAARQNLVLEDICYGFEILTAIEKKSKNFPLALQMADSLFYFKDSLNRISLANEIAGAEAKYHNIILRKETILQSSEIKRLDEHRSYLQKIIAAICLMVLLSYLWLRSLSKRKKIREALENEILHAEKLTESIEQYRKNRATELHDDVGQELLLAHQSIEMENPSESSLLFVQRALNKIRKISNDEYPYELNYVGLKKSLEHLIDLVEQNSTLTIAESLDELPDDIPQIPRLNIYRIIQEMINNTLKNKKCDSVFLEFKKRNDKLRLTYLDSGPGFDFEKKLKNVQSIGLKSIVNRARLLGSEIIFVPSKEENKYIIDIPLSNLSKAV